MAIICDQCEFLEGLLERLELKQDKYLTQIDDLKDENWDLKMEIDRLKAEIAQLNDNYR
jgi:cell division protein FtsB